MTTTAKPRKRPATYADLEAVPPNMVAEILGGELVTHPRPRSRHGVASTGLGILLGMPFQFGGGGPGGWIFVDEPELRLGDDVVVPDLAAWRRERFPNTPDAVAITIAPDWVCEVISPSTASYDRTIKLNIYLKAGIKHLWYVHPGDRTLEILKHNGDHWGVLQNFAAEDEVSAEPFEAVSFSLAALWVFEPPPPAVEGA